MKHGKKYVESAKLVDRTKLYEPAEALETVVKTASAKFAKKHMKRTMSR